MADDDRCPMCGGETERPHVDVGVGNILGPAFCLDCDWEESAPTLNELIDLHEPHDDDFIAPHPGADGGRGK